MNKVTLQFNDGFSWMHHQGISFKGYFSDEQHGYVQGRDALKHFMTIGNVQDLKDKVRRLNGCFSVVIRQQDKILLGVDCLSFFTLFYSREGTVWHLSDNWYSIHEGDPPRNLNRQVFPEFQGAGFVMGSSTLDRSIMKTRPGTVVQLNQDGTTLEMPWFDFLPRSFMKQDMQQLEQQLSLQLERIAHRLIESLEGRTAVVPLSGGYDSRLIACMLKKADYPEVVCITYGRPNPESETSQRVAAALGYPWHMTDYTRIDSSAYLDDPLFQAYYRYAGNGFAMPYLQEYFATKELKEKGIVPDDAVFIPGHSGDWLAGSYLQRTIHNQKGFQSLPEWIRKRYFGFAPIRGKAAGILQHRIERELQQQLQEGILTHSQYSTETENWDALEKLPKFIFHSAQVFPFFGYPIRFPLWDQELRDFFRSVPFEYREEKKLYNKVLEQDFFSPLGVHLPERKQKPTIKWPREMKNSIRQILPMPVALRRLRKHDYICYEAFTSPMDKALKKASNAPLKRYYSFNAKICRWYLHTLGVRF